MQAEKEAETSRIRMQQLLQEREAERAREMIQNDMYLSKHKALADAEHYRFVSVTTDTFPSYSQATMPACQKIGSLKLSTGTLMQNFAAGHTSDMVLLEKLRAALFASWQGDEGGRSQCAEADARVSTDVLHESHLQQHQDVLWRQATFHAAGTAPDTARLAGPAAALKLGAVARKL